MGTFRCLLTFLNIVFSILLFQPGNVHGIGSRYNINAPVSCRQEPDFPLPVHAYNFYFSVFAQCPSTDRATPTLHLTTDVPAYAMARCRNADLPLTTTDKVNFILTGNFNQSYVGQACQFYVCIFLCTLIWDFHFRNAVPML